jgi:hypothetical protein
MTIPITRRITSIVLVELVVLVPRALPLRCLLLTVSPGSFYPNMSISTNSSPDSKQARDLVGVLQEAKQQIDPRLHEMTRYGGGGGGRYGGRGYGRGGHRGRLLSYFCIIYHILTYYF